MRKRPIVITTGLTFFVLGYALARHSDWIVHRAGFYTNPDGRRLVSEHRVTYGDFGVPMLSPLGSTVQTMVVGVYLPLRVVETLAWHVMVPPGSEWPKKWKIVTQQRPGADAASLRPRGSA